LVVAVTFALSSTAVVVQNLMERKEQASPLERTSIAILIF